MGSFTTAHLAPLIELAARASGLTIDLYEGGYGQYRQELLNPTSELYARDPEVVILAVHEGELGLPPFVDAADAAAVVESELANWTTYWETIAEHSSARIVQYNFTLTAPAPFGHLTTTLPGSRHAMAQALNLRLGASAAGRVGIVDCERLASSIGKERWFSARQWHSAKPVIPPRSSVLSSASAGSVSFSISTTRCGVGSSAKTDSADSSWGVVRWVKRSSPFSVTSCS